MRVFLFALLLSLATPLFCAGPCAFAAPAGEITVDTSLKDIVARYHNMIERPRDSILRDSWLEMENKFAVLRDAGKGETAAQAAFYHARTREALAVRSGLAKDSAEVLARYSAVAKTYPKSPVAPAALYRQAAFLQRTGKPGPAVEAFDRLIQSYPDSDESATAKPQRAKAAKAAGLEEPAPGQDDAPPARQAERKKSGSSVVLKNISWEGGGDKAVITLELDGDAAFTHAFLPPDAKNKAPARVYLDIPKAVPSASVKGSRPKGMVVSRIRTGSTAKGTRITLECDEVLCYAVRQKAPQTIEIEVSSAGGIKDGIMVGGSKKGGGSTARSAGQSGGKSGKKPQTVMEQLGLTVQTIMIDAGHGGKDPGAIAGGVVEKDFTLAMAKRVGRLLEKKGFTVIYTRGKDAFITLQDRPDLANTKKADLFISIHVNANPHSSVRGLETYYLDSAKTQDAAVVAARENAVSVKNISDLQVILTDLMLSSKLEESRHLAKCVQRGILKRLRASNMAVRDNGSRSAPFYVLMGARMPAILVEFGYITNPADAANLKKEAYLQKQAEGLVEGILQYKAELARSVPGKGK